MAIIANSSFTDFFIRYLLHATEAHVFLAIKLMVYGSSALESLYNYSLLIDLEGFLTQ